jgi:hypothetical protein
LSRWRSGFSTAFLLACAWLFCTAAEAQQSPPPSFDDSAYTLHVTVREVVVDLVAVDSRNHALRDLTPADLSVSEKLEHSGKLPGRITRLRLVEPSQDLAAPGAVQSGFRIGVASTCQERASLHYELSYQPSADGWASGFHQVQIAAANRGVRLFYRHRYYVGETSPPPRLEKKTPAQWGEELRQAACAHPTEPFSISLRAALIASGRSDVLRYSVSLEPDSLQFVSLEENGRKAELDYAACNFNAAGQPLSYFQVSIAPVMSPVDFARAQAHGFPRLLEFPARDDIAMTRFVVRDRATGNLGTADVLFRRIGGTPELQAEAEARVAENRKKEAEMEKELAYGSIEAVPPPGPIGSFGSIVPTPGAFCGDVYEIPNSTGFLPDYRTLDPVGSIYTHALVVPNQQFWTTPGIPGVTSRNEWFGVDYYGFFWIRTPGKYRFRLTSDDGAVVQIDDQRVTENDGLHSVSSSHGQIDLDAGRHSIHVPYFQGPIAVALVLMVQPPGEEWKVFDLRDYAPEAPAGLLSTP